LRNNSEIKVLIAVILLSLLASCSLRKSTRVLSFFFDGVPVYDSSKVAVKDRIVNDTLAQDVFRPEPIVSYSGFNVHYPYKEKECFRCHDEKSKSELIFPQPDLCYSCHEDFRQKYKKVHGPAASGYCTICHNPHMSKEQNLLIRSGQQICLFCHDSAQVMKSETHKDIADTECTLCHNPHGGDDRFILN
jgi:predicted CXXCH cytochrome family protein